jgi:hypothetical protein
VQVTATNDDETPQTGTCNLTVDVVHVDILPIDSCRGGRGPDDGRLQRSPYAPPSGNSAGTTFVAVQGVVYEKTLARTASGGSQNGFFLQNTATTADADPNTSDGVFVFMGNFTSLIGGYVPQVGDEVVIRARVTEFFNLTELTSASALLVVRSGVDLDAEVPTFDADPPDNFADAGRYWERREGMRARIVPGSVVLNGRNVFPARWTVRYGWSIPITRSPSARATSAAPSAIRIRSITTRRCSMTATATASSLGAWGSRPPPTTTGR